MTIRNLFARWTMVSMASLSLLSGCGLPLASPHQDLGSRLGAQSATSDVSLIVMPEAGPQPVLDAINHAKKSILLEMYILTNWGITQQIVEALIARSKEGLDVRIILESQPYIPASVSSLGEEFLQELPAGVDINQAAFDALVAANVRVKRSSPRFSFTHEKAMVIDDATAYIMTMNFSNSAFKNNREYIVADTQASDVREVTRIFEADWNDVPFKPQDPDLVVSPTNSRSKIIGLIDQAKKDLVLQCEYLTDPEVVSHLAMAQNQRHVAVSILLAYQPPRPDGGGINADEAMQLAKVGIKNVRFAKAITMHAKAILIDGAKAYVGSENMTSNSLDNNREMGIILKDRTVVSQLARFAASDWQAEEP